MFKFWTRDISSALQGREDRKTPCNDQKLCLKVFIIIHGGFVDNIKYNNHADRLFLFRGLMQNSILKDFSFTFLKNIVKLLIMAFNYTIAQESVIINCFYTETVTSVFYTTNIINNYA